MQAFGLRHKKNHNKGKISKAAKALLFPRILANCNSNARGEDQTETTSVESIVSQSSAFNDSVKQQQPEPEYEPTQAQKAAPQSYASLPQNLILVNRERCKRGISPLRRSCELDALARMQADAMANQGLVQESSEANLRQQLGRYWGENVAFGDSLQDIHGAIMVDSNSNEARNIVDPHFRQIGVATAKTSDGLFFCQIFRG